MTMPPSGPACLWCGRPFPARRGGSPKRFCCAAHRVEFWSALRRWDKRAVAAGMLRLDQIRNADPAACTLLLSSNSPAPIDPPATPAPVAPAERSGEAEALLDELLAVRSEGWRALAAAMSEELFERLKWWRPDRLAKNRPRFRSNTS